MKILAPLALGHSQNIQEVEVFTSMQIPALHIIGLPSPEVSEAKDRIRAAIEASGFHFPRKRVVLNLSPASIRKRGTGLDLPMALAVLMTKRKRLFPKVKIAAWGELGLDGTVKSAGQVVSALFSVWKNGIEVLFFPKSDRNQAREAWNWIRGSADPSDPLPTLIPIETLKEALDWIDKLVSDSSLSHRSIFEDQDGKSEPQRVSPHENLLLLPDTIERQIGIIASGSHHFLMLGPPGVGKTHSLEWLLSIYPPASFQEKLEHRMILELSKSEFDLNSNFPARRVSMRAKPAALTGGCNPNGSNASWIRPGEFSLAHGGILIADEFMEWAQDSREALREPLEMGEITITRAYGSARLPARFLFAATGNPCPCGGASPTCHCPARIRQRYLNRLSGPIMDRLDLILIFRKLPLRDSSAVSTKEKLVELQNKVIQARKRMKEIWGKPTGMLSPGELGKLLNKNPHWNHHLNSLDCRSLRSRHKTLRLALTLALWDGENSPEKEHFSEAFCYRAERIQAGDEF